MSRKLQTQTKPPTLTSQPPAKTNQPPVKSSIKDAPKTATKGGNFDPAPYVKLGYPEENVLEIKKAFDLFDTDLGGFIDGNCKILSSFKNLKPLWFHLVLMSRMDLLSK